MAYRVKNSDPVDTELFNGILERLDKLEKLVNALVLEVIPEYKV